MQREDSELGESAHRTLTGSPEYPVPSHVTLSLHGLPSVFSVRMLLRANKSVSIFSEDPSEKLPLGEYQLLFSHSAPSYRSFKCLPDIVPRGTAGLLCSWILHM